MMTDTLSDLLTRIRNGHRARHASVRAPWCRISEAVCGVLQQEGYIRGVEKAEVAGHPGLVVTLAYDSNRKPAILGLRRISKPGRRLYRGKDELPRIRAGLGVSILTTPQGVMTDAEARKRGIGGEVICEVW